MNLSLRKTKVESFLQKTAILWVLLLLCIAMTIFSPTFITPQNLMLIIKQSSITGILAIGMTMVILTGEIDLSVASIIAFSSVCSAMFGGLADQNMPLILPILVGLAAGVLFGLINGFAVSYLKIPSFIMTLASMMIARGVAKVLCNGKPVFGISESFYSLQTALCLGFQTSSFSLWLY